MDGAGSTGGNLVVRRNDWTALAESALDVQPSLTVSVVIPTRGGQDRLDLVLAALAAQTYPAALTEVVVVDDGSDPPLVLPQLRPSNCRIVSAPATGWGRAHACHVGALASSGQVLHWLDADMLVFPDHLEQQLRWHHVADYVVTIGYKRLVGEWSLTPDQVHQTARDGGLARLFETERTEPHAWVEELIAQSDGLRTADAEAFRAAVGATGALHRELYLSSGGMDTSLRLGEDSELAYRLAQRGAVFVPVPAARSWHLGIPTATRDPGPVRRYNWPHLADRMPLPRFRRWQARRSWRVPFIEIVVDATAATFESVATCVDSALAGTLTDCRVTVTGPWSQLHVERRPPLDAGPDGDLRLVREHLGGDARVQFAEHAPDSSFPATFRLELPPSAALTTTSLERLVACADRARAGLVEVTPVPDGARLWRTAARERARLALPDLDEAEAVAQVWGRVTVSAAEVGFREIGTLDARRRRALLGRVAPLTGWARLRRRPAAAGRAAVRLLTGRSTTTPRQRPAGSGG